MKRIIGLWILLLGGLASQAQGVAGCDTLVTSISAPVLANGLNISCHGGMDGSATVSVTGGCIPYGYMWSNGQIDSTAIGLVAGTYTVTVTDSSGQSVVETIALTGPAAPLALTAVTTEESCVPGGDGAIDLTVTGGSPGYTYAWSGGQTTQDVGGLGAGSYTVSVTDTAQCISIFSTTVYAASPPFTPAIWVVLDTLGTHATGVTYQWNLNGNPIAGANASTYVPTMDGSYTVTVTNPAGCSATSAPFLLVASEPLADNGRPWTVCVYDLNGNLLERRKRVSFAALEKIRLEGFPAGVYIVDAQQGGIRWVRRVGWF